MADIIIQEYFDAGRQVLEEQEIVDVNETTQSTVWRGRASLPPSNVQKDVLVYQAKSPDGHVMYRAIPAKCPHQGADLSEDPLKPDGNVYCHLHRRPICVFSEYNFAFDVKREGSRFFLISKPNQQ